MKQNTKIVLGLAGAVAVGYWIYSRKKAGKSLNPFAKSTNFTGGDNFFNASGKTMTSRRRLGGGITSGLRCNDIPAGGKCSAPSCAVDLYDENGRIYATQWYMCSGGKITNTLVNAPSE
jgi:hypothetical protein